MRETLKAELQLLHKHILDEGYDSSNVFVDDAVSYVSDEGFFTYRMNNGIPYLMHFWVNPDKRNRGNGQKMMEHFKSICNENGKSSFIMALPSDKHEYDSMLKDHYKTKLYLQTNNKHFYVVEV